MNEQAKKKEVKHMSGRDLELDVIRKIHKQLDRLPNVKDSMRALAYIQSVTHEGSPAYGKQKEMFQTEPLNGLQNQTSTGASFP